MFTRGLNFWSKFWQEPTHASKYWRGVKILTTGQNISNRYDASIFWVNVFFDKKISHTRSKIQLRFWCQFFASIYWRIIWSCMGPLRLDRKVATNVIGPLHECKKVCPCTKALSGIRAWIKQARRKRKKRDRKDRAQGADGNKGSTTKQKLFAPGGKLFAPSRSFTRKPRNLDNLYEMVPL